MSNIYTKELEYLGNGKVYAGMFYPEAPDPFPTSSDDVPDIVSGYGFETGSYIYSVTEVKLYMYDADSQTWVEQTSS